MASFEYKCRRCGQVELNPHCSDNKATHELINVVVGLASREPQSPQLLDIHSCKDGGQGVKDLQGFRYDTPPKDECPSCKSKNLITFTPEFSLGRDIIRCRDCGWFKEIAQKKNMEEALDYAISIIESYEMDIRNSYNVIGINIKEKGFCQGRTYKNALRRIDALRKKVAEKS